MRYLITWINVRCQRLIAYSREKKKINIVRRGLNAFRRGGPVELARSACRVVIRRLDRLSAPAATCSQGAKVRAPRTRLEVFDRYRFVCDQSFGKPIRPGDVDPNTINWVIPDFESYSGGHLTIFRLADNLEKLGFKSRIVIGHPTKQRTSEESRRLICENFLPINCPVGVGEESLLPAYFTFASNWTTAHVVKNFASTVEKCYIVQDYEPYFYPHGTDYHLAAGTYDFGFKTFVAGDWLAGELKAKHNVDAHVFNFACDEMFYEPPSESRNASGLHTLLFYCRPSTPRRGFELGMMTLEKVVQRQNNVEVILAGCDLSGCELPARMKSVGIVPLNELPTLYRRYEAALIISFTNVSLLPLDLMAGGCAVVSNNGPHVEWLLNNDIAELAAMDPDSLASAVHKILIDEPRRREKIRTAREFVKNYHGWSQAKQIADVLRASQRSELPAYYAAMNQ